MGLHASAATVPDPVATGSINGDESFFRNNIRTNEKDKVYIAYVGLIDMHQCELSASQGMRCGN